VKKWVVTVLGVIVLAGAATWLTWWPPDAWRLAKENKDLIGLVTNLVQWALWIGAVVMAPIRHWAPRRKPAPEFQTTVEVNEAQAKGDVNVAGRDVQTGGVGQVGNVQGVVAGGDGLHIDHAGQVQIIREAGAASPLSSLHQLPAPPADFTGREKELDELAKAVERGGVTISGVAGMGGVGKTALALKLAAQLEPRYPEAQFYLDLKGTSPQPLSAADAMAHVIRGYHPEAQLPEGAAELAALYRSVLHGKRALLLMDNAASADQVQPLIPCGSCVLLVTSRQYFTLSGFHPLDLEALPPGDARDLLLKIAPRIGEHADEIARLCGYLPMALELAARTLAQHRDLAPGDYVSRLGEARTRLDLVEASLSLSYDLLDAETQRRWRVLSVFPDTFDVAAAAAVCEIEPGVAQEALSGLVARSMVEWDETSRRYRLHDLLRLVSDARMSDAERPTCQRSHVAHYVAVLGAAQLLYLKGGESLLQGLRLFDSEWANIQAGQAWAAAHAAEDDAAARLCNAYGDLGVHCTVLRVHPRDWIVWLEAALTAARRLKDRQGEGNHLGNLGLAYARLGEARRAIEFFEQALAMSREIGDRRGEGNALGNLGIVYKDLGEPRRAIEFYEQALAMSREIGDRRGEGNALGNLGLAHARLGETRRAIEFHEQALAILREIGDRQGEGNALGNLGAAYADLGEPRRAVEFYEQALLIDREIGDRRGEGTDLGNLGIAYKDLGETRRAIEFYNQQLVITREVGDRRGEGNALGNLGNAYLLLDEARGAIEFYEQQLAITREIGDRRGEGNALGNLGNAYLLLDEPRRAIEFYEQALLMDRELGGRRGEGTTLWNMSQTLDMLGERAKAIANGKAALVILEQIEHPDAGKVRKKLEEWGAGE